MTKLRSIRPSWPAILLFTALLAQAPHAAAVFIRIAPHEAQWEVYTSFVGAWVYAIALEGATAYFVWRNKLSWAIAFAVFSVAHNIAYYMPSAWTVDVWGATLTVSYIFSAILISMSLPIAIAAFSHVQSTSSTMHQNTPATPVAVSGVMTGHSEQPTTEATHATNTATMAEPAPQTPIVVVAPRATPTRKTKVRKTIRRPSPAQRQAQIASSGLTDAGAIAATFGVSVRTAQLDLEQIRKMTTQTNGASHA